MTIKPDRRKETRSAHRMDLTLKVIDSTSRAIRPGHTFEAGTADISRKGVRIRTSQVVPVDTRLELWIISSRHRETLVLPAAVRWSLPVEDDPTLCEAGLEIVADACPDYLRWIEMVDDLTGLRMRCKET